VKEIAEQCDLLLVVGSRNSSNSVRLVEVGLDAGAARPTWSTTTPRSTRPGWTASTTVGLTSGASVPEELVVEVMAWLAERGYGDVQEVESAQEHLLFASAAGAPPRPAGRRHLRQGLILR
jgi:4-hydroxy-3-methylbut-2-enyl diphosphate reductase